jgi:hypothetical protein
MKMRINQIINQRLIINKKYEYIYINVINVIKNLNIIVIIKDILIKNFHVIITIFLEKNLIILIMKY